MCRVLQVSRDGYYKWLKRSESRRSRRDRELTVMIARIFWDRHGLVGRRVIHQALRSEGVYVSEERVRKLMRKAGLVPRQLRKFVRTTDSQHGYAVADNLLEQDFSADAPNRKWCGDITYVWTKQGWLYHAVVIDLYNREVVGWAMSKRIDAELISEAMLMALTSRRPPPKLIFHSDRGVQYASRTYRELLAAWGVRQSMSRKGNCYDNAVSESFFATLKKEVVYLNYFLTRQEARETIFQYIAAYYNTTRLHSSLGYLSPRQFELRHTSNN